MKTNYVMNEAEKKLVDALRSGMYKQVKNYLRVYDMYCCLGVACDIFNKNGWFRSEEESAFHFDDFERTKLPENVRQWLKWATPVGHTEIFAAGDRFNLAQLNDDGLTFDQIADIIESGLISHIPEDTTALVITSPSCNIEEKDDSLALAEVVD
jgi:hypothetical protein